MKKIKLNSGYDMPIVGLGTWLSESNQVYNIVKQALEMGYRHIDCAAVYGNEKEVGKALKESITDGIVKREEVFITSKLWNTEHKKEDVLPALEQSLNDLEVEYLDLYLMHWPVAIKKNSNFPLSAQDFISLEEIPLNETYEAMEGLVKNNLCRSIGVSNFSLKKLKELQSNCEISPAVNQVELHPYLSQNNLLNYCKEQNIVLTCYSPLGSSGRPDQMKAENEPRIMDDLAIKSLAQKYNKSEAQIILNWSISRGTIVIPKTVTPSRAEQNLKSQDFTMETEDYKKVDELDRHYRFVTGEFFTPEGCVYTISNLWDE